MFFLQVTILSIILIVIPRESVSVLSFSDGQYCLFKAYGTVTLTGLQEERSLEISCNCADRFPTAFTVLPSV